MMNMNPMQLLQIFNQLGNSQNPMSLMQKMFGNNPAMMRAIEMSQGKNSQELQNTVKNLCSQSGVDFDGMINMLKSMGLRL